MDEYQQHRVSLFKDHLELVNKEALIELSVAPPEEEGLYYFFVVNGNNLKDVEMLLKMHDIAYTKEEIPYE